MFPRFFELVVLHRLNKFLDEKPLTVNKHHKEITPKFFSIYHHSDLLIAALIKRGANPKFIVDYQKPLTYAAPYESLVFVFQTF